MSADAAIERLVKALTAACSYECQLANTVEALLQVRIARIEGPLPALAEASRALHAAVGYFAELQHRLPDRAEVLAIAPGALPAELLAIARDVHANHGMLSAAIKGDLDILLAKLQARERAVGKLREVLEAELASLRGEVLAPARALAEDIAHAANQAAREEHARAARERLQKVN
jgi:hypothetical protein